MFSAAAFETAARIFEHKPHRNDVVGRGLSHGQRDRWSCPVFIGARHGKRRVVHGWRVLLAKLGSVDEIELAHRGKKFYVLAAVFILGGLGLAGFPPFGPYLGKDLMAEAGKDIGMHWYLYIFLFASIVTGGAVLRFAGIVFFGFGQPMEESKSPTETEKQVTPAHSKAPVLLLTVTVVMVLMPLLMDAVGSRISSQVQAATERFVDQSVYADAVLRGQPTGPIHARESKWHLTGFIEGLGAAIGAAGLAALALVSSRLPKPVYRFLRESTVPFQKFLERLHVAHIGDLIVWLLIGVVAIGIVLATG